MDTMTLWHITGWEFAALAAAALLVGFSKTAVSGANTVSLAIFAAVLLGPRLHRRTAAGPDHAAMCSPSSPTGGTPTGPRCGGCSPRSPCGVVGGTLFLMWADDGIVRTSIGAILLMMAAVTVWRRRKADAEAEQPDSVGTRSGRIKARSYGVLGGFTTMVANAGGPVMSMYLLSAGFRKLGFLGTSAFFFLIVNVSKVPFSVGLGLIDGHSLLLDAALVAFVVPGAFIGKWAVDRINQRLFEQLVIAATVLGGLQLLLR